jgi:hypothetical protein
MIVARSGNSDTSTVRVCSILRVYLQSRNLHIILLWTPSKGTQSSNTKGLRRHADLIVKQAFRWKESKINLKLCSKTKKEICHRSDRYDCKIYLRLDESRHRGEDRAIGTGHTTYTLALISKMSKQSCTNIKKQARKF